MKKGTDRLVRYVSLYTKIGHECYLRKLKNSYNKVMVEQASLYPRVLVSDTMGSNVTIDGVLRPPVVGVINTVDVGYFNDQTVAMAIHKHKSNWFEFKYHHKLARHMFFISTDLDVDEDK